MASSALCCIKRWPRHEMPRLHYHRPPPLAVNAIHLFRSPQQPIARLSQAPQSPLYHDHKHRKQSHVLQRKHQTTSPSKYKFELISNFELKFPNQRNVQSPGPPVQRQLSQPSSIVTVQSQPTPIPPPIQPQKFVIVQPPKTAPEPSSIQVQKISQPQNVVVVNAPNSPVSILGQ